MSDGNLVVLPLPSTVLLLSQALTVNLPEHPE